MTTLSGFDVTVESIPAGIKKEFPLGMTEDDFNVRLNEGGELVLDGNTLKLGSPDFAKNSAAFLALDKLILKNGARIVTGGNVVTIIVNELKSDRGEIISFLEGERVAATGENGSASGYPGLPGRPGDSGGLVSIHVVKKIDGHLKVDLSGQAGGSGGNGGQGAQGAPGPRGHNAQDAFPAGCAHSGQDGHPGGQGLPGGTGGNGGVGGSGGVLEIYNVGSIPIDDTAVSFVGTGGSGGAGGNGGPGGLGGKGGEGGSGSRFCGGGHGGPDGEPGPAGVRGVDGPKGADGTMVKKNLNLVGIVQIGVSASMLGASRIGAK